MLTNQLCPTCTRLIHAISAQNYPNLPRVLQSLLLFPGVAQQNRLHKPSSTWDHKKREGVCCLKGVEEREGRWTGEMKMPDSETHCQRAPPETHRRGQSRGDKGEREREMGGQSQSQKPNLITQSMQRQQCSRQWVKAAYRIS